MKSTYAKDAPTPSENPDYPFVRIGVLTAEIMAELAKKLPPVEQDEASC